jgi:hypothetical protein
MPLPWFVEIASTPATSLVRALDARSLPVLIYFLVSWKLDHLGIL